MKKIDSRIQKQIAIFVLDTIEPEWKSFSKEDQIFLFNNMKKGVHKFIVKEYNRRQQLLKKTGSI
jgi:hypothetical protein